MRLLINLVLGCLCLPLFGQYKVPIHYTQIDSVEYSSKLLPRYITDTNTLSLFSSTLVKDFRAKGFFGFSVDSLSYKNDTVYASIYIGHPLSQFVIEDVVFQSDSPQSPSFLKSIIGKPQQMQSLASIQKHVVSYYENRGYPFCAVSLDSFKLLDGKAFAKLLINPDLKMTYDTIEYIGSTKVRKSFLRSYLGLMPSKKYNEEVFSKVDSRLKLLPFVELTAPSSIVFENEKAKPKLYLKDRKSNQFDLLIGLLPGSSGQRVLITADIFIHLISPFGMGEEVKVKWQKLQPKTQTLDVHLVYPYLLGIPLGINAKFDLFKVDTSFLNLNGEYGVQYQLGGPDVVKLAYRNRSTIVLFTDTNFIKQTNRLPQNLDVSSNEVMMELNLQRLNYRFNPTSGFQMKFSTSFGIKKIKKSNSIATLFDGNTGSTFNRLYDSIQLNTFTTELSFSIDKFWRINRRNTIRTNAEGAYIFNQLITQNELYRIGGLNSLRGFDDRSILTPYYLMANLEYRFLISRNAFFFMFFNSAMVKETRFFANKPFDFPFGFGAGSTIETKIGMFALSYAMGTQQNQPFTFRSGKIHFGYINFF